MDEVGRKRLPHEPPMGVGVGGVLFFITVCAADRAGGPLVRDGVAEVLLEAVRNRHERGVWYARVFLVMPDHVHGLVRIPQEGSLRQVISDWKRWTAAKGGFAWQRDFFDHRLRGEESVRAKADYILENPVRAGLVERAEEWAWRWVADD